VQTEPDRLHPRHTETDEVDLCSGFHERPDPMTPAWLESGSTHERPSPPYSPSNDTAEPLFTYVPRDLNDAVERWLPKLRRMAAYWAFPEDPDDLLQEVWLELHRSWGTVVAAKSPLAMALQIAKRRCVKVRRRRRGLLPWPFVRDEAWPEDTPAVGVEQDPERRVAALQEARRLHQIISGLGDRQREAFLCRRLYELTGEETAEVLRTTRKEAYKLEEAARLKIEAEWNRQKARRERGEQ
jgi:RNA polymerase sigma factor (sigma-70 family)